MAVKTKKPVGAKKTVKPTGAKAAAGRPTANGPWLTTQEAAEMLGLARKTLENWRTTNEPDRPKAHIYARRVWYKQSDVQAWLDAHKEQ